MILMAIYHLFIILVSALCVPSTEAKPYTHEQYHRVLKVRQENETTEHKTQVAKSDQPFPTQNSTVAVTPIPNITSSLDISPAPTSRDLIVFDICTRSESQTVEVDPCNSTIPPEPTSTCSTVLKGFFAKITVTDCSQLVTFSKTDTFVIATVTGAASLSSKTSLQARQLSSTVSVVSPSILPTVGPEPSTYVQKITTYYVSPWQAVAADEPNDITVIKCKFNENNVRKCSSVKQVWVAYTKYVAVTKMSTISVDTSFSEPALLALDSTLTIPVSAGPFNISTELKYTTSEPVVTYSVQAKNGTTTVRQTSTTTRTTTVPPQDFTSTITRTVQLVSDSEEPSSSTTTEKLIITELSVVSVTMTRAR